MSRKLAALLVLCLATLGAEAQTLSAAKGAKPGPRLPERAPSSAPVDATEADLVPRSVFDVLLGEIALQRGDIETALGAWIDLAKRSRDPKALARASELALHARQNELALELARLWVQAEPESQRARQALTSALILLNRSEELAPQLSTLLERDKDNLTENLMQLPRLLARYQDKRGAQQLIDQVASPYVGIAEAHAAMAMAALAANDNERARSEAERTLQLRPDWEYAAILVAQTLARDSNAKAITHLEGYVANYPKASDARLTLARLLIGTKRFAEARIQFKQLIELRPEDPELLYPAAMLALQDGDRKTGKELLERLLSGRYPDKSSVHFFLGQIDEDEKNTDAAIAHYRMVSAGDQYSSARGRLAALLAQQGKLDEALKTLRDNPGKTVAERTQQTMNEAALLREAKRYDDASKLLESSLRTQPDNAELRYEAAMAAEKLGKYELMESHLQKLIKQKPDHAHALNALGYSLAERNIRLDEAAKLLSKASELAPKDPFIMDSVGWLQFRQGKLPEALATLEAALKLRADPEIAAHLGEVLWTLNRRDEATTIWRNAAALNPENDAIKAVIRRFLP